MIETATSTTVAQPTSAPAQKLKAVFSDNHNRTIHMDYNGPEHLFRIRFGAVQRLFFFDELFQKLILRNEYGVIMGQLTAARTGSWVRIDDKRYRYSVSGNDGKLSLSHPASGTVLTCAVAPENLAALDARHKQLLLHCLVFAFAWAVG